MTTLYYYTLFILHVQHIPATIKSVIMINVSNGHKINVMLNAKTFRGAVYFLKTSKNRINFIDTWHLIQNKYI